MALKKGDIAPHIKLVSDAKERLELTFPAEKHRLILFFPFAFSSSCSKELTGVKNDIQAYEELNTEVYAISVDSPYTLAKFKKVKKYPFTLLSDFNRDVSRAYDALFEVYEMDLKGVSKRAAYVIDREGIIQYAEVLEDASQVPNFADIKDLIAKFK